MESEGIRLRQGYGHSAWFFALILWLLGPVGVVAILRKWGLHHIWLVLAVTSLVVVVSWGAWFWRPKPWVRESAGKPIRLEKSDWNKLTRGDKLSMLVRGLVQLELLGWLIWVVEDWAAVVGAFGRLPGSNVSRSEIFWGTLENAAPDLTKAAVVAVIVLFFGQIMLQYQKGIDKAGSVAETSEAAIRAATNILPYLKDETQRSLGILKIGHGLLGTETAMSLLGGVLEKVTENVPALSELGKISEELRGHVVRLVSEVVASIDRKDRDDVELAGLGALLQTYLQFERVSFEGEVPGDRGCRLSTRFAHYALAVQELVTYLRELDPKGTRFEYYTILNKPPAGFFNVEDHRANPRWSVSYLEDFCRSHSEHKLHFQRVFLACEDVGSRSDPPDHEHVTTELELWSIVCDKAGRPLLWAPQESREAVIQQWGAGAEKLRAILFPDDLQESLAEVPRNQSWALAPPCYFIVHHPPKDVQPAIDPHGDRLVCHTLKDVLPQYHSLKPQKWVFPTPKAYTDFFGANIPRDLFAVYDRGEKPSEKPRWRVALGTMVGHGDPIAVTLIFMSPNRFLDALRWPELESKLDQMFLDKSHLQDLY